MHIQHSPAIWRDYPELVAGVIVARGMSADVSVDAQAAAYTSVARQRLETGTEAQLPEIQAWRRTFSRMGLKPTQYRCASESLLRRFRKEGSLPPLHPLIDLCNAVSLAYAIPVAVFDVTRIAGGIEVRHASGSERYEAFSGEMERPGDGEVIFADEARIAHARRWTHRQSGLSAVRESTTEVLIVAEAMHDSAAADIERLVAALVDDLAALWPMSPATAILSEAAPRFTF
jgi:DNA/RNA-binding domain of Phe-tRNA-synthetase-like protein